MLKRFLPSKNEFFVLFQKSVDNTVLTAREFHALLSNLNNQQQHVDTIAAYEKIGSEAIKNVRYSKTKIDRLIKESNKESDINKMYSKRVREAIKKRFPENAEYKKVDLLNGVSEVFRNNGVKAKVNINTIKKYYGADELNGKRIGFVKLYLFKPDYEFD